MHALRHFYASTLLAQGVSIKELATYLGHADPGFTLRVYTHLVPSSHQRRRLAVDTVFGNYRNDEVGDLPSDHLSADTQGAPPNVPTWDAANVNTHEHRPWDRSSLD
ncbi:tyrosine-type recombinase/integrase [Actinophytocola oryzae]|uniref:tyrosine-type recombinase/integrase n=1 Tax=Actinophytocola oryzae TaxID=502181 RepID=UPI001FBB1F21|nr:tyrosine-type recombinase/integrase [Actinophytocola oryzae]